MGAFAQEPLVFGLGQIAWLMVRNRWGNELLSDIVPGNAQLMQVMKERFDALCLALAGIGTVPAPIHLCLICFQVPEGNVCKGAGATVFQKRQQVYKVVAV